MALEHVLRCDDEGFAEWTAQIEQSPSIIEQIPAAAHDGACGNHIVINQDGKTAYASLANWASDMSVGELRAIGFWMRVPTYPHDETIFLHLEIDSATVFFAQMRADGDVRMRTYHDGGSALSNFAGLFTAGEWHHIRVALVRSAALGSNGGVVLYDGNTELIDARLYDTNGTYDGTPTLLCVGVASGARVGTIIDQDEFRIATTLAEATPRARGGRMMTGAGG